MFPRTGESHQIVLAVCGTEEMSVQLPSLKTNELLCLGSKHGKDAVHFDFANTVKNKWHSKAELSKELHCLYI